MDGESHWIFINFLNSLNQQNKYTTGGLCWDALETLWRLNCDWTGRDGFKSQSPAGYPVHSQLTRTPQSINELIRYANRKVNRTWKREEAETEQMAQTTPVPYRGITFTLSLFCSVDSLTLLGPLTSLTGGGDNSSSDVGPAAWSSNLTQEDIISQMVQRVSFVLSMTLWPSKVFDLQSLETLDYSYISPLNQSLWQCKVNNTC